MSRLAPAHLQAEDVALTMLDVDLPVVELSELSEQESWRKEINRPLYHIHKWWATRLGSVFRAITLAALTPPAKDFWSEFYKRHDLAGKVILDPFMGSGTTLGEALKLGAKAIGCDINPVSSFLVRQALTPVSEAELRAAFKKLEETVAPEIQSYYQTRDPDTGEFIPVLYFFWVKTLETPAGEIIPLFRRYVFAQDAYPKKKPRAQIVCPHCWAVITGRYDAAALTCPDCSHGFNPQEGPASGQQLTAPSGTYRIKQLLPKDGRPPAHRMYAIMALRANGEKIYLKPQAEDFALFEEASLRLATEELPLPTLHVRPGNNTDQARGYNYHQWRDFFNARQLLTLGLLLREILRISDCTIREQLVCLFSSTLEFNNLFCSFKGEGTGAVRHMFSNHILKPERTPLENSVWGSEKSSGTFSSLFESRLIRAKRYLAEPFELALQNDLFGGKGNPTKIVASFPLTMPHASSWNELAELERGVMILNGDSANLPLPDACVDAVITDPPYFDFVHYSELSDFFFAWLAPVLKCHWAEFDRADSSAPGEVQDKDPRVFARHLGLVFSEAARVLKDDGLLTFSFHHSREDGWAAIYEALNMAGLSVVAAHPVHAEMKSASPKSAALDPISIDAILVCRKQTHPAPLRAFSLSAIAQAATQTREEFTSAGLSFSKSDAFVIAAAHALIQSGSAQLSYPAMHATLAEVRANL
ncbi:MAG: hypothetical protein DCC46_06880 [Armatimonadetes bacterium]|nr:MAG: hypothetical protein DCC46_06880 [Armatimonadota bacterium]